MTDRPGRYAATADFMPVAVDLRIPAGQFPPCRWSLLGTAKVGIGDSPANEPRSSANARLSRQLKRTSPLALLRGQPAGFHDGIFPCFEAHVPAKPLRCQRFTRSYSSGRLAGLGGPIPNRERATGQLGSFCKINFFLLMGQRRTNSRGVPGTKDPPAWSLSTAVSGRLCGPQP
jgi:hypothetical protein